MALAAAGVVLVACRADAVATDAASPASPSSESSMVEVVGEAQPATVLDLLEADQRFATFLELYGDVDLLRRPDWDNTLFALTDDAFATLGDERLSVLRSDPAARTELLERHVVGGRRRPSDMGAWLHSGVARTAAGAPMPFSVDRRGYRYELVWGGAPVVEASLEAGNGLVHVLDTVAVPGDGS